MLTESSKITKIIRIYIRKGCKKAHFTKFQDIYINLLNKCLYILVFFSGFRREIIGVLTSTLALNKILEKGKM